MKILVIGGGTSDEREVSLKSSQAVLKVVNQKGDEVDFYDWDGSSSWIEQNIDKFDIVLPILHGTGGEDGVIQSILEKAAAAFLGSGSSASSLCFDKNRSRTLFKDCGIRVPKGEIVDLREYQTSTLRNNPHVLKPYNGGSSVDTFIHNDLSQMNMQNVQEAFKRHHKMLVEEYIVGTEITVPILEGKELPVIEIVPPEGETFDYENKYNGRTAEIIPPHNVGEDLQKQAVKIAKQIHKVAGCRHLSRTDIIIKDGKLYTLEVNTMPGMTDQSLFPKAAQAAGLDFPELVDYFIKLVLNKV